MSLNLKDKTVLVWDNGLFVSFAEMLTRYFGKVLYFMPWADGFPESSELLPGDGIDGMVRVKHPWEHIDDVDLWVFPDIYHPDEQEQLRKLGKRVWGGGWGEELERNRDGTKRFLKRIGLPVQHWELITGIDNLRDYLKQTEDKWIKVSEVRGDMETWHHKNYTISEVRLDELEQRLGPRKRHFSWIVEDNIDPAIEVGFDGWCIDGKYPDPCFFGVETKDAAFIGMVRPYDELPEPVKFVNAALAPTFKNYGFRGFFSSELRITPDLEPFLIDPCPRLPSPPNEVYQELFSNWGEILWHGAEGEIITPEPVAKFGVVIMLHSTWAVKHWTPINIKPEYERWLKLRYMTIIDGKRYFTPQTGCELPEVGGIVGIGDTLEDAIAAAKEHAVTIQAYDVEAKTEGLDDAIRSIEQAKEYGIELFEGEMPTPSELVNI